MNGKIVVGLLMGGALIAGAAVYVLQVYAFYEQLDPAEVRIEMVSLVSGQPEPVPAAELQAIDASSSPLRFRACFTVPMSIAALTEEFVIHDDAVPLNAPRWFDCFDAATLGAALEQGRAIAFLGAENIRPGVDRIVAVHEDGRGFAWHQLNDTLE